MMVLAICLHSAINVFVLLMKNLPRVIGNSLGFPENCISAGKKQKGASITMVLKRNAKVEQVAASIMADCDVTTS